MLKTILTACALTLSLTLATEARATLESTIDEMPSPTVKSVVLSFPDPVDADRSKVRVFTSYGREIAIDELQTNSQGTDLIAPISMPLSPGTYKIFWQTVSRQGRVASGVSKLTVPFEGASRTSQVFRP